MCYMYYLMALHIHSVRWVLGGFPAGSVVKNSSANEGDTGLIHGSGRSPGGGNGNPPGILAFEMLWTEEPGEL